MLFFAFCLFLLTQISKDYCQKSIIDYCQQWILRVLSNFYYITNIFDLHIFENETAALLIFFSICTDMHFGSLFFPNERNMTTSFLMIHLKYTAVDYANLN